MPPYSMVLWKSPTSDPMYLHITSSFQSQNVYFSPQMSSLHWKSKFRNAWGQPKRVCTLRDVVGISELGLVRLIKAIKRMQRTFGATCTCCVYVSTRSATPAQKLSPELRLGCASIKRQLVLQFCRFSELETWKYSCPKNPQQHRVLFM